MKRRDNRREYDDLIAQQRAALWTSIMGVAAITGMILSVVGVYLVYTTFQATKRGAAASESAARAAWVIGKSQAEPVFVFANPNIGTYQNPTMPFHFGWNFKNIGKSPALGVTVKLVWLMADIRSGRRWEGEADVEIPERNLPAEMSAYTSGLTKLDPAALEGMTPETYQDGNITIDIHISCRTVFGDTLNVVWRRAAQGRCAGWFTGFDVPHIDCTMGNGVDPGSIVHLSRQEGQVDA